MQADVEAVAPGSTSLDAPTPTATPSLPIVYAITVQADDKVLAGGGFTTTAPNGGASVPRNNIARFETDGRVDQTLGANIVNDAVFDIAIQPDGKILIAGNFTAVLGVPRGRIARLNTDSTLDLAFNPVANDEIYSIAIQPDGQILVGGYFSGANSIGGQTRNRIARLDAITGLADSFNPNADGLVESIALQSDGSIIVAGGFNSIGGQPRNHIARLSSITGLADSLNPDADSTLYSAVPLRDNKFLIAGFFTSVAGQPYSYLARLDGVTGLPDSFNPHANSIVWSVVPQEDGKLLVAGNFSGIGGQTRNSIARLDATTGLADSFNPNPSGQVYTIVPQTNGKILVCGVFGSINGQTRNDMARLDSTTGIADSFNPNPNYEVYSIALQADGKILAGGYFTNINGQTRNFLARFSNDVAAQQNLTATQSSVTWTRKGSSPQLTRVTFESSTDNIHYVPLGNGSPTGSDWNLTGLNLPSGLNLYIRARGCYHSGVHNTSESMTESVRNLYLSLPSPSPTATASASATPSPTPTSTPGRLGNISTRLRVETGDNALIGGFIVTGTQPKRVILRAIGPSVPVAEALANPTLELRNSSGGLIRSNDNWRTDQEAEIVATGVAPTNDLESAIVATLPANNAAYTAIVRGQDDGTGVGLVEAYDLDQSVDSKLANISTRGLVQTEDNVLIAGTIVLGQASQRVLVRALGPSLPVDGKLADPTLELRDGNGTTLRSNDNWRSDQEAEIIATTIPPTNDLEAALVHTLLANGAAYTAIVRGSGGTTGVALVEIYALD